MCCPGFHPSSTLGWRTLQPHPPPTFWEHQLDVKRSLNFAFKAKVGFLSSQPSVGLVFTFELHSKSWNRELSRNCVITLQKRREEEEEERNPGEMLDFEDRKPLANREQGAAPSFTSSFWVSFCCACFLPFQSDVPGWFVRLSLSLWSWHGDVLCFALSVVSPAHKSVGRI